MLKTVYRSSRSDNHNCQRRDSNLGLLTPQSDALTTRPLRPAKYKYNVHNTAWLAWRSWIRSCTFCVSALFFHSLSSFPDHLSFFFHLFLFPYMSPAITFPVPLLSPPLSLPFCFSPSLFRFFAPFPPFSRLLSIPSTLPPFLLVRSLSFHFRFLFPPSASCLISHSLLPFPYLYFLFSFLFSSMAPFNFAFLVPFRLSTGT